MRDLGGKIISVGHVANRYHGSGFYAAAVAGSNLFIPEMMRHHSFFKGSKGGPGGI
jgi:hypothetical protein